MVSDALIIDNVSKSFGEVRAVENLSASLPAGCIYGFLGPNGAGKTTTIRMIMNIIRQDCGTISVLGESNIEKVLDRIGYLPEERGLYRKMTVRKVLYYIGSIKGMKKNKLASAIPLWLEKMDLAEWADKKVETLSRGMQQKLQFIATVINDPELLILDEPFSGLDPINLDLLKEIMLGMRSTGKTVVFSTHMMEHAEKLCDYILLIDGGRKIFDGALEDIRSRYDSNVVSVDLEGDTGFIRTLPVVKDIKTADRRLDITLDENADSQEFLKSLVGKVRVMAFEEKVPSLHEIFIHLVGRNQ